MVKYTLTQSPDVVLTVPGKDSPKARDRAMDQLIDLVETGKLPTDLSDGFSPQQFIEVKDDVKDNVKDDVKDNVKETVTASSDADAAPAQNAEEALNQAVQMLSNLATLKLKVQVSRTEAMKVRSQVDNLFTDDPVDEAELEQLKEGFKVLKTFAQANLRYREARIQAEQARTILDQALSFSEPSRKSEKAAH